MVSALRGVAETCSAHVPVDARAVPSGDIELIVTDPGLRRIYAVLPVQIVFQQASPKLKPWSVYGKGVTQRQPVQESQPPNVPFPNAVVSVGTGALVNAPWFCAFADLNNWPRAAMG